VRGFRWKKLLLFNNKYPCAAFTFFFTCQGRVYSLTLLANFLVGIPFRRDNTTTDGSTASRSPQGQYASAVTGVLLDVVYGYDTESASNQSLSAPRRGTLRSKSKTTWTGTVVSKAPLGSGAEPVPYNYVCPKLMTRLDSWTKILTRLSPRISTPNGCS
jgi:hypothetical protein